MDDHDKEKRREQIVFMCSGKFEAQVTNNRRLQSMVCTIEAADRHEASCGLSETARLLVTYWNNGCARLLDIAVC